MNLTLLQRLKRRVCLWGGSYTHPDGTIELDVDEKAGVDPTLDSEEVTEKKLYRWLKSEAVREDRGNHFLAGLIIGGVAVYWWLR